MSPSLVGRSHLRARVIGLPAGKPLVSLVSCALFGFLFRAAGPAPELSPREVDGRGELLLVVGPSLLHPVLGQASQVLGCQFLKRSLVVAVALAANVRGDPGPEQS